MQSQASLPINSKYFHNQLATLDPMSSHWCKTFFVIKLKDKGPRDAHFFRPLDGRGFGAHHIQNDY